MFAAPDASDVRLAASCQYTACACSPCAPRGGQDLSGTRHTARGGACGRAPRGRAGRAGGGGGAGRALAPHGWLSPLLASPARPLKPQPLLTVHCPLTCTHGRTLQVHTCSSTLSTSTSTTTATIACHLFLYERATSVGTQIKQGLFANAHVACLRVHGNGQRVQARSDAGSAHTRPVVNGKVGAVPGAKQMPLVARQELVGQPIERPAGVWTIVLESAAR